MDAAMEEVGEEVKAEGGMPYIIPGGGSNPIGAMGYVNCAVELLNQAGERDMRIDHVVLATGSAGTQAGLVTGLDGSSSGVPVLGIGVNAPKEAQEEKVYDLACRTAEKLDTGIDIKRERVIANCDYVGPGYGIPREDTIEAIRMFAELEGILLDDGARAPVRRHDRARRRADTRAVRREVQQIKRLHLHRRDAQRAQPLEDVAVAVAEIGISSTLRIVERVRGGVRALDDVALFGQLGG